MAGKWEKKTEGCFCFHFMSSCVRGEELEKSKKRREAFTDTVGDGRRKFHLKVRDT